MTDASRAIPSSGGAGVDTTATPGLGSESPQALSGIRVLELGHHVAASYCGKLLADLGALVFKVEAPSGDPLRSAPPLDPAGPRPTSGLFHYLNANKRGVAGDLHQAATTELLLDRLPSFDAVVENFSPGTLERFGLSPKTMLAVHPGLVIARISNYGQYGPWRDRAASDHTLQADVGLALRLQNPASPPVSITGRLIELLGGTFAASATLAGLAYSSACGHGCVADVSILECLLAAQSPAELLEENLTRHGIPHPGRQRVSPGFVAAADHDVCVSTLTAQNWIDLCHVIGASEWIDRMKEVQLDGPVRNDFLAQLSAWTGQRTAAEVIDTLQSLRVSAAAASDGRTILQVPPFVERHFFVPHPGASFLRPSAPYRLSETPVTLRSAAPILDVDAGCQGLPRVTRRISSRPSPATELPLSGRRVVDLTGFLAGGHLAWQLAALGADVVKVESPTRPDNYRFVAAYPQMGDRWWERSTLWQGQNQAKRSLALDLKSEDGRRILSELIARADVVAENFTPRVVESFGLGYDEVHALNPSIVMVRMPAFGLEGSWRDHAGFAYNIEQIAGLAQNGHEGGPLVQPAGIVDVINGQHALVAVLAALRHRDRTGRGQLVEVAQVETVACLSADQVIEFQLTGTPRRRPGNRSQVAAPQGIYAGSDGRYVAVTVTNDSQWLAFCALLDRLDLGELPLEARQRRHDELDGVLSRWFERRPGPDSVELLQELGIPAAVLATLAEVRGNPHLRARSYYRRFDHHYLGEVTCSRSPVLFDFGELAAGPPPMLDEHSDAVLRELGIGTAEIAALREQGVVSPCRI